MSKNLPSLKRIKRRGFTLVELLAVMSIMAILSTIMVPKILGYIKDAKKVSALEEVRQVVLAVDTHNINAISTDLIGDDDKYSNIKVKMEGNEYVDFNYVKSIPDTLSFGHMKKIINKKEGYELSEDKIILKTEETQE